MKRVHSARPAALVFGALWLLACSDGGGGGKKADDGGVTPSTACGDDAPCADGKSCVSGRCIDATEVPVTVSPDVRACEVLVSDAPGAQAVGARFGGTVKGSFVRRAPRLGLSLVATKDAPIDASDLAFAVQGSAEPDLVSVSCFDGAGKALPASAFQVGQ